MNHPERIDSAQQRAMQVYARKPASALSTTYCHAVITEGLRCDVTEGDHHISMDMPVIMGGDGSAPTPGVYARAAIAGCVALGLRMAAAREGIALRSVAVDLAMDFDDSAIFGMGTNTAAPLETRLTIRLDSDAPADRIAALVDPALACDPYFLALRDAQQVRVTLEPV